MTDAEITKMSTLSLAHIGDGVYELLARTHICGKGVTTVVQMHKQTVAIVNAAAQAKAAAKIAPLLTEAEHDIYKRGRNARVNSVPKGADIAQYHAATGLETLFGWLYLRGETARIDELFKAITEDE